MVVAGPLLADLAHQEGCRIIPVDSEHSAIFQCLRGNDLSTVRRIILTASGGPFRTRPAEDQHAPMAFDPRIGKTVFVVDRVVEKATEPNTRDKTAAETWLYDLGDDAWTYVETAQLPDGCGMNYNMEYDPVHELCLLVTGTHGAVPQVWALRVG